MSETLFIILSFAVALLGGASIGAVIGGLFAQHAAAKERKIRFLDDQIRKLYGPLYYFVSKSEKLLELRARFESAYDSEFCNVILNDDNKKAADETINIENEYIHKVTENNREMQEILDNSSALIDPSDIDMFLLFYENHIRLQTEKDSEGKIRTPHLIYHQVGDIHFLHPEVTKRVKNKYSRKREELDLLLGIRRRDC